MKTDLFASSDGALVLANEGFRTLRDNYSKHHFAINSGLDLRSTLRAGPYAWPGGYPLYFIVSDGASLSFDSVRQNLRQILHSIRHKSNDGWRVVACNINYEDSELICEHSGEKIPSAYGGD